MSALDSDQSSTPPLPAQPKRRWRRRIAWSLMTVLGLLLFILALAPIIVSTSLGRDVFLARINRHMQGKLEMADWSVHWAPGMTFHRLCLYDERHNPVLTVEQIRTGLSLWNFLHGRYLCGETEIDGLDLTHLIIHKDGSTNLQLLLKKHATTSPATHAAHHRTRRTVATTRSAHHMTRQTRPRQEPIITGDFHITRFTGLVTQDKLKGPIIIDPSEIQFHLAGPGQPITQTASFSLRMEPFKSVSTINTSGQIFLINSDRMDMKASTLDATLAFDHFEGSGIVLGSTQIPLQLRQGVLQSPATAPIPCNGGQLDIAGLTIDWTGGDPRLNSPAYHSLLKGASINPLLGDSLGKFINPMFTNNRRAQGLLDITLDSCNDIALADAIKTEHSGSFTATFSLHDMDIVNPLGSQMVKEVRKSTGIDLGKLFGIKTKKKENGAQDPDLFQGEIDHASVRLERGRIDEDIVLRLSESSTGDHPVEPMELHFIGQVKLHDLSQKLDVTVPPLFISRSLGNKQFAEVLDDLFPDGIPISLRGTTKSPKLDISRSINRYNKHEEDRPAPQTTQPSLR